MLSVSTQTISIFHYNSRFSKTPRAIAERKSGSDNEAEENDDEDIGSEDSEGEDDDENVVAEPVTEPVVTEDASRNFYK
jgi:hypothetical protein